MLVASICCTVKFPLLRYKLPPKTPSYLILNELPNSVAVDAILPSMFKP